MHDHRATLVRLLSDATAAIDEAPADKRAALISAAARLSADLAALDAAQADGGELPADHRRGAVAPSASDGVTALDEARRRLAARREATS